MLTAAITASNRYTVLGTLGEGGMGTVFKVIDADGGEPLALKTLTSEAAREEGASLRFKQEFRTLAGLRHAHICAVKDYGRLADDVPYFTMELVEGQDMRDMIPFESAAAREQLGQVLGALSYLHGRGFVHGDIKPENIRVRPDGSSKLMDFGLLAPLGQPRETISGTLAYMAPEVAKREPVDQRGDLYATGAVWYELLTGQAPFSGGTPLEVLRRHLSEPPRPPQEIRPEIPDDLSRLIMKLLAKDPVARYQTAGEVLLALGMSSDEVVAGPTLFAPPFVGRAAELSRFQAALGALSAKGGGQIVRLVGESGAGKSRLLGELRFMTQLADLPYIEGRCVPGQGAPYAPFVALLRALLPVARTACPADLALHTPLLGRLLPELADHQTPGHLEPDQEKLLIKAAIATLIVKVATHMGAVVVLDGWEHADPLSREMLATLIHQAPALAGHDPAAETTDQAWAHVPLLLVVAGGEGEATDAGHTWRLEGLSDPETALLLAGMLGHSDVDVPDTLVKQVQGLTGGNPGQAVALLEHAAATGGLSHHQGRWVLPETLDAAHLSSDVLRPFQEKLAALGADAGALARLAAMMDEGFDLGWAAVASGMAEETLFDTLAALIGARILTQTGDRYRFVRPELAKALAAELPPADLARLHRLAATRLEASVAGDAVPDLGALCLLARHHLASGEKAPSLQWALAAGTRCLDLHAIAEAVEFLQAGYQLLQGDDAGDQLAVRGEYAFQLAIGLGRRHELAEAETLFGEAGTIAEQLGDRARQAEVQASLAMLANLRGSSDELRRGLTLNERAMAIADELKLERVWARAATNRGRGLTLLDEREPALVALQEAARRSKEADLPFYHARSLALLGFLLCRKADTSELGTAHLVEAAATQARIGDKYGLGYTRMLLAEIHFEAGRYSESLTINEDNARLNREIMAMDDYMVAELNVAFAQSELGEPQAALTAARLALREATARKHSMGIPTALVLIGRCLAGRGELPEAVRCLKEGEAAAHEASPYVFRALLPVILEGWLEMGMATTADAIAREAAFALRGTPDDPATGDLAVFQAELSWLRGELEEATNYAATAVASALARAAEPALLRAFYVQSQVALASGRTSEALHLAGQIQTMAIRMGAQGQQVRLAGLQGDIALIQGLPEAQAHFQTMQALADLIDLPFQRARALFGQVLSNPASASAPTLLSEAQRIVRDLAVTLEGAQAAEFLEHPACKAILARNPVVQESMSDAIAGSQEIMERFGQVGRELTGLSRQYGLLFEEWQASNSQLRQLNALATRMNESLQIDEVLKQVVSLTLEITRAERGFVILEEGGRYSALICKAAFDGLGRPVSATSFSLSICQKVMENGLALTILDASTDEEFQAAKSIMALEIKTVMCVPLVSKGKRLGVLYVDSQALVTTFTQKDLELMKAIANHASVAIENAKLYESLGRHAAEMEAALELYRKAEREANTDILTGLPNRRRFLEASTLEIGTSSRFGQPMSVIMMDVDHFKKFNDTYGHATGDEVLKAVGRVMPECVREGDLPARLGGEEFVVMCPATSPDIAATVAEKIREAISRVRILDADGHPVRQITASLGIAALKSDDTKPQDLLDRADIALYACKRDGRNQVQIWQEDMPPVQA